MLEPDDGKLSRPVLRGLDPSNGVRLLGDTLVGLIEPMISSAGANPLGSHPKQGPTGGCSRSTELTIVVLKRYWHQGFRWKTGRQTEKAKLPAFEVTTAAHDSRAVGTAQHQSHRTIDPQCLKKSPPRRGGVYALAENVSSPFHAEPTHECEDNTSRVFILTGSRCTCLNQSSGDGASYSDLLREPSPYRCMPDRQRPHPATV